jgi:nucleoside-diphosphate kinase
MKEKTFAMIKPDGVARRLIGKILMRIEQEGFQIAEMKMQKLSRKLAGSLYAAHAGKNFYDSLLDFVTSGPVVLIVLERKDGVAYLRDVAGATDPAKARPDTLRSLLGTDLQKNALHASETSEDAEREISLFFETG